jgi:DnaA-homolog protein
MLDSKVSGILMRQLPLPISAAAQPSLENYVAGANAEALERVRALVEGRLKEAIVYVWGAPGSGRTHLLGAAAKANPALVIADDVEALDVAAQQALFIAINTARDGGPAVLAAGNAPPAELRLREDLRTRLGWGLVYQLKPLTDAEKALYLRAEAARRGLRLADEVVWYLLNHLPRDLGTLRAVLDRLDRHSLARQRAVTLSLVREALSNNNDD